MGISGVVLAPVILSFAKVEMKKVHLGPEPAPLPIASSAPQERAVVEV